MQIFVIMESTLQPKSVSGSFNNWLDNIIPWLDKITPHEDYFDANATPYGILWKRPFCPLQKREIEIEGNIYNSCEQFINAKKATLFGDTETLDKIMKETNPQVIKQRSKEIINVHVEVWKASEFDIITQANYHKFSQHADLKILLLSTGDKLLVECRDISKPTRNTLKKLRIKPPRRSKPELNQMYKPTEPTKSQNISKLPTDQRSSTTFASKESYLDKRTEFDAQDTSKWNRKNYIGQSLMIVRKRIRREEIDRKARLMESMMKYDEVKTNKSPFSSRRMLFVMT